MHARLLVAFLTLATLPAALAQDTIHTALSGATVYRQGALVTRVGTVTLPAGERTIAFSQLELGIVEGSVQLGFGPDVSTFKLATAEVVGPRTAEPGGLGALRTRADSIDLALADLAAEEEGLQEALRVIAANRALAPEEGVLADEVLAAAEAFRAASAKTRRALARLAVERRDLEALRHRVAAETQALRPATPPRVGEVTAQVLASAPGRYDLELTYLVTGAGWDPAYDLFVYDEGGAAVPTTADLTLVGDLYQATGVDWDEIDVTLSTGDPSRRLRAPELVTQYAGERQRSGGSAKRVGAYDPSPGVVRGVVRDETGEFLIGANVVVQGTSIGTVTDYDGRFELDLPRGLAEAAVLEVSYLGYETYRHPVDSREVDVKLSENGTMLDEVVVVGYSSLQGRVAGVAVHGERTPPPPATFARETDALTTREYPISRPVTLAANGRPSAVRLRNYRLPLALRHRAVPRLDPTAYLEGVVTGYDSLRLSAGALRVHYAGRYLGDDYLDPDAGRRDTLQVALGADDQVRIRREALDQERDRRALSSRVAYALGYRISVHNTRARAVDLLLEDQVPVSRRDDIKVEIERLDGAPERDTTTGKLTWDMTLAPGDEREVAVGYEMVAPAVVRVGFEE